MKIGHTKRSLLDISDDLQALDDLLFETGGDVSDESVASAIEEWFAEVHADEAAKVGNYIGLIREKELRAAAITEEIERYKKLQAALTNSAKGLKDRLKWYMENNGKKKIKTPRGNASICGNGGKQPIQISESVQAKELPPRFQKVEVTINSDAVREALEKGEALEFAALEERGTHLRIR